LKLFQKNNKQAAYRLFKHYKEKAFFMRNTNKNIKKLAAFKSNLEVFQVFN
jgi:hypothetical protein